MDCFDGFVHFLEEAIHRDLTETSMIDLIDLDEPDKPKL